MTKPANGARSQTAASADSEPRGARVEHEAAALPERADRDQGGKQRHRDEVERALQRRRHRAGPEGEGTRPP